MKEREYHQALNKDDDISGAWIKTSWGEFRFTSHGNSINPSPWPLGTLQIRMLRLHTDLGRESSKDVADKREKSMESSIAKKVS